MIKLLLLIILTSGVINATPVQDDVSIAAANGIDELLHDREERSSGSTRRPGIPWYLDRIDQRKSQLDGQYNAFSNGKNDWLSTYYICMYVVTWACLYVYSCKCIMYIYQIANVSSLNSYVASYTYA